MSRLQLSEAAESYQLTSRITLYLQYMDLGGSVDWLEKNAWSPPLTHFFTVKLSTTEAIKRSTREEKKTERMREEEHCGISER